MVVEFWFEFGSSYSYPAAARIERLSAERSFELRWRPFLLGPIFQAQGWNDSPFNLYPAKGAYMWRDLERICDELKLPLTRPSVFPRNGLLATRIACRYQDEPWMGAFVGAIYRANFADDQEISEPEVVRRCLSNLPVDPDTAISESKTPDSKAKLRTQTESAKALGIFGAPTVVVADELFWGNDRLEAALDWAENPVV
jgi:2-hydroxychromene-2-carboxylate isomerase